MEKVIAEKGPWCFIIPISNVLISKDIGAEFIIDRILLISGQKLTRIRNRIGFPYPFSTFNKKYPDIQESFFNKNSVFATTRYTGNGKLNLKNFLYAVNEELALLALSQLGDGRRRFNAAPEITKESGISTSKYFMINQESRHWILGTNAVSKRYKISLSKNWIKKQREMFFIDLLNIIRKKTKLSDGWVRDIRNAAILAGQSQMSLDLPQAFLWNMIAIELLLTKQGDHYSEKLPERAEAFLAWTFHWYTNSYETKIKKIYKKRCELVHAGRRDAIQVEDLLFSDTLLLNVLTNIVKYPKIFRTKDDLINFSDRIQAESLLGIKSKVRPKNFRCSIPVYSEDDLERI
jgi:hypothetical protein